MKIRQRHQFDWPLLSTIDGAYLAHHYGTSSDQEIWKVSARCAVCGEKWQHLSVVSKEAALDSFTFMRATVIEEATRLLLEEWCYPNPRVRWLVWRWRALVGWWGPKSARLVHFFTHTVCFWRPEEVDEDDADQS